MISVTQVFKRNLKAFYSDKRRALNEGGTSSSKTFSILQALIILAHGAKENLLISVVAETFPHLKRGAMRDFLLIMEENFDRERWNKTDSIYDFGNAKMEFFSADDSSKLRGARRDILFLNEANNISFDSYRELDIRTRRFTFLDWNPVSEFWAHENGLISASENEYIHSTYLDAKEVLPPEVIANIESNRDRDPNWWNVYGLGLIGKIEGLVYPYFEQEDRLPDGGEVFFGLDFGYSTDPTALVKCVIKGDELHRQELIYEKGLKNNEIAQRFEELGLRKRHDLIIADSAEPKSIDEIYRYGWNIFGCSKGAGSVEFGHQKVRQYKLFWTKDSLNGIKEQRNFRFLPDKDGKLTDKTTHSFSHLMDAVRYGVMYISRSTIPDFSIQAVGQMRTSIGGR